MIKHKIKILIERFFKIFGLAILINTKSNKPVGSMFSLLADLKNRGLQVRMIFDVGAHKGEWSKMVKLIFPDASIYMFEPQIEMIKHLEKLVHKFSDIRLIQKGVGSKVDKLLFTIWDDFAGSSFLPKENENLMQSGKQREIEVITLDTLLENTDIQIPDIVKLDIQGYELEALKGGASLFGKTEVFILEVALYPFEDMPGIPTFIEVVNFMFERGYVVYDFGGFLRRPLDNAVGQCDLCFVKLNGALKISNEWN
jgi:FkbM family methyltransferase